MSEEQKRETVEALAARAVAGDRAALETVVLRIKDDVYNLALRFLGAHAEAEDATQEILIQVVTHLGAFRGESTLRTWAWRIATRHVLRLKKSRAEEQISFEAIEALCAAGNASPPLPPMSEAELAVLIEEVRLTCTQGMLTALDRDLRIAWTLVETFGLDGEEAARVLDVEPATFRKRLSRARERLGEWMHANCSLVNRENPCNCRRQVPVALAYGVIQRDDLQHAGRPRSAEVHRRLPVVTEADLLAESARVLCSHPDYAAPERVSEAISELVEKGRLRPVDA